MLRYTAVLNSEFGGAKFRQLNEAEEREEETVQRPTEL
jgi:hypothetical protein